MNSGGNPGLYVHVPFCKTKCPYCGFHSSTALGEIPRWLDALCEEAKFYVDVFMPFDSLYLGGGTPSILPERDFARLMECLHERFSFLANSEITVEVNPDDVTRDKLTLLRESGVNRISVGVQSFDDHQLTRLGRRHTARQAETALEAVRGAGFDNFGIDLMFGLERQSETDWLRDLERAVLFDPAHLSCYQLTVEEGTAFALEKAGGRLRIPGERQQSRLFLATAEFLEKVGFIHYEVSNYARDMASFSRHNCKYWRHVPYLGLGPSAHSFLGRRRWWNVRSLEDYCSTVSAGVAPVRDCEELDDDTLLLESLLLGFRTRSGVARELLSHAPGAGAVLRRLKESGLIEIAGDRILPTEKGFLVADSLPLLFTS